MEPSTPCGRCLRLLHKGPFVVKQYRIYSFPSKTNSTKPKSSIMHGGCASSGMARLIANRSSKTDTTIISTNGQEEREPRQARDRWRIEGKRFEQVQRAAEEEQAVCHAVALPRASNASSSSGSAAAAAIEALQPIEVAPKRAPTSKQDTCTWYKKGRCSLPVPCEVCINVEHSDQLCGLGPGGACVDMSAYPSNYTMDSSTMYFPSANFTYCAASDQTCSACKSSWMQVYKDTGDYPMGKLCQGEQGCICVSQCESPSFSGKVITGQCSLFGGTVTISRPIKHMYTAVSIVGVLVIGFSIFRAWRREKREQALAQERREHREELRRERNALRGINGSKLSLTGWKSLQEKLLESERKYLDGGKKLLDQLRHAAGAVATIDVVESSSSDDFGVSDGVDGEYEYELEEGLERDDDEEDEEEMRSRANHQHTQHQQSA